MVETTTTEKFNADMVKVASSTTKDLMKTAGADDKWVKVAEFLDHSITSVVDAIKEKNKLQAQQAPLSQGIQNPQGLAIIQPQPSNAQNQVKEPHISWKLPQAIADLREWLKTHEAELPIHKTLGEILEDEEYNALISLSLTQQKIADFLNKYIQLIWT